MAKLSEASKAKRTIKMETERRDYYQNRIDTGKIKIVSMPTVDATPEQIAFATEKVAESNAKIAKMNAILAAAEAVTG